VKRAVMLLVLTMPPGMEPGQLTREVMASISFGQPVVEYLYAEDGPPDDEPVG
jgi:hypothetical protein